MAYRIQSGVILQMVKCCVEGSVTIEEINATGKSSAIQRIKSMIATEGTVKAQDETIRILQKMGYKYEKLTDEESTESILSIPATRVTIRIWTDGGGKPIVMRLRRHLHVWIRCRPRCP